MFPSNLSLCNEVKNLLLIAIGLVTVFLSIMWGWDTISLSSCQKDAFAAVAWSLAGWINKENKSTTEKNTFLTRESSHAHSRAEHFPGRIPETVWLQLGWWSPDWCCWKAQRSWWFHRLPTHLLLVKSDMAATIWTECLSASHLQAAPLKLFWKTTQSYYCQFLPFVVIPWGCNLG